MDRLTTKIDATKEKDIQLKTRGVFRPLTRQIGNSLADIKDFFDERCQDGVTVVPSECPPHLKHYKDILLHQLKAGSFLFKKNIVTGTEAAQPLLMLMDSLALAMDLEVVARPSDVVCDVLLALCNQPVIVLTLVDGNSNSDMLNEYNTSVAREVTGKLKTFMDERVCVVSGVCCCEDIENPNTFYDTLKEHAQRSSFFIPLKTFETQMPKLNNIVTAIWASVAETNSVKNEDIKRFLTMEQCVVLLENINKKEVKVYHKPGSGATTLMLEVARRLSRLNETLLVWNEDVDKKSVLHPSIKTLTELPTSDQRSCANIVVEEDAGEMTQATKHQRCWKFVQLKEDESVPIGEFEYRETKNASREQDREQKIQKQVTRKSITDMDLSKRRSDYLANEIRIVLVGKVGVGKSSTGNTILDEKKFKSLPAGKSVTKFSEHASTERFDRYLQVVDVPGFRDTSSTKEKLHKLIMQCVALVSPGIHAILFVVRIGRYTEEDVKTVEDFIQIFGPKSRDFVIVVFTGEDDLEDDYDLQKYVQDSEVSLKTFLREVNQRFIAVNNKSSAEEKNRFVKSLLEKIEQLLRDNKRSFYTCEMVGNAEENIKMLEDKRAKEKQEIHRERDERIIAEALEEYKAQLAKLNISKEEESKLIEEKKGDINIKIDTENHVEARNEVRVELSETIKNINIQRKKKSDAGLYVAMGAGATAGTAVRALGGPIGAVIGGLAGATYGALLNWWA